jgi:hypothetical protein
MPSSVDSSTDLGGLSLPFGSRVQLADVNNDGEPELVVQSPVGAHSIRLRVFGWGGPTREPKFGQICEKVSNLASPYAIRHLEGDGQVELSALDTDWSKNGANNASGPYLGHLYRWDGDDFAEVG